MISIIDLKKAKMQALKEHDADKQSVLGVLIAGYQKTEIDKKVKGEEMTDADMVSLLNKVLKELEDEKKMYVDGNRLDEAASIDKQMLIIKSYLPLMMSEEEITKIIEGLSDKSIKSVMAEFKTKYAGKVDMGLVSKVARSFQK
ncbi:MAG: GatB/YqeY domain-containing protein [Bacilli bacterium]